MWRGWGERQAGRKTESTRCVWGQLNHHQRDLNVAPGKADLDNFTMVGSGPREMLKLWDIKVPMTGKKVWIPPW